MVDSSTIARKNVTALKVRYLKEQTDTKGLRRTCIQNRVIGVKYHKDRSTAQVMLDLSKEKLFNLDSQIIPNFIGFIHDRGSNLYGEYEGLGALLGEELPSVFKDLKMFVTRSSSSECKHKV